MKYGKIKLNSDSVYLENDDGQIKFVDDNNPTGVTLSDISNSYGYTQEESNAIFDGYISVGSYAGYHDLDHSPVALYQFNNNLNDSSGNNLHLSVAAGNEQYMMIDSGLYGVYMNGLTRFVSGINQLLQISGDCTVECIVSNFNPAQLNAIIVDCSELGETLPNNILYQIDIDYKIRSFWEYGSGSNVASQTTKNIKPYTTYHIATVRSGTTPNVTNKIFVNGILIQTFTSLNGAEKDTSGNIQILNVGNNLSGTNPFTGFLSSLKIIPSALTDAQVLNEYKKTLGRK